MMRLSKEPMTVAQLKRYVDPRFRRLRSDIRLLKRDIRGLREYISQSTMETRRHFDIALENFRHDLRMATEPYPRHSQRLDDHETRITRLEQRL
jgi:hypothetical protein